MSFQQFSAINSSLSSNGTHILSFFERCSKYHLGSLLWSCLCLLSFLFGVPVSLKVLWELQQGRRHKGTNNFFLLNIAVINLTGTTLMPGVMLNYTVFRTLTLDRITNHLYSMSMFGRPLFMACICGDIYFAVAHPVMYRNCTNSGFIRKAIAGSIWIYAICFSAFMSSVNWTFTSPLVTISMFISLPTVTFCTMSVLQAFRKPDLTGTSYNNPQKKRFVKSVISSCIVTCFVYVPTLVILPLIQVLPLLTEEHHCNLAYFGMCFSILGTMSLPFVYLYNVKKIGVCAEWRRKLGRGPLSK